jgi:hypothetical protein
MPEDTAWLSKSNNSNHLGFVKAERVRERMGRKESKQARDLETPVFDELIGMFWTD